MADGWDCCTLAESGLLGDAGNSPDAVALESATDVISLETVSLEREVLPALAFFLAAVLLRSRVPSPSELQRACSRMSSCTALR